MLAFFVKFYLKKMLKPSYHIMLSLTSSCLMPFVTPPVWTLAGLLRKEPWTHWLSSEVPFIWASGLWDHHRPSTFTDVCLSQKNNPIIHNTWGILFGLTVHWNLSGEGSDFFSKYLMAIFDHHLNKLRKLYKKGQKWSATFYMHIYTSHFIYESGFSLKSAKESQENFTSALKYTKQFPLKTMVLSRVIWV